MLKPTIKPLVTPCKTKTNSMLLKDRHGMVKVQVKTPVRNQDVIGIQKGK